MYIVFAGKIQFKSKLCTVVMPAAAQCVYRTGRHVIGGVNWLVRGLSGDINAHHPIESYMYSHSEPFIYQVCRRLVLATRLIDWINIASIVDIHIVSPYVNVTSYTNGFECP